MTFRKMSLGSLCANVYSGGTPNTSNDDFYGGDIPWLRTQEVVFESIFDTEIKITEKGLKNSSANWVPANSVIVAMYGNSAGRSAITKIPLTTNQACCNLIIDGEKADYRFVFYALRNNYKALKAQSKGAAQNNLNASQVKEFTIDVPDLKVQEYIGDILSRYDDLIENNRRRIQLLEESARLLYREWFVHLRFPGHEHVKIKDGVPEGWARKTIRDLLTLNYGKALNADARLPGLNPVYGSSGEVGSHSQALVKGPGIIVGRKGNVGRIYWINKDYWPIDTVYFINSEQSNLFIYHALQKVAFINTDVAVPGLNRDMAYSREILIPAKSLMDLFIESVELIQNQIEKLTDCNIKLVQARDLLLPRLMNGEIPV